MDQFDTDFASHWDELVGWEKRSEADVSFLIGLLQKFDVRNVLDVALGTGFHSVKLIEAGFKVKSVDISKAMIEVAQQNAQRHNVELDVVCSDWVDLTNVIKEKFDCVLCLGNSLACEMDLNKRKEAIRNWSQALSNHGIVVVDRRNYEALLESQYNMKAPGQYFGDTVKITPSKVMSEETVFSYTFADGRTFDLKMFPILDNQIRSDFSASGLHSIEVYGDRKQSYADKDVGFFLYVFGKMKNAEV